MRYHLTPVKRTIIKKPSNTKYWRGCGEKATLLSSGLLGGFNETDGVCKMQSTVL